MASHKLKDDLFSENKRLRKIIRAKIVPKIVDKNDNLKGQQRKEDNFKIHSFRMINCNVKKHSSNKIPMTNCKSIHYALQMSSSYHFLMKKKNKKQIKRKIF